MAELPRATERALAIEILYAAAREAAGKARAVALLLGVEWRDAPAGMARELEAAAFELEAAAGQLAGPRGCPGL